MQDKHLFEYAVIRVVPRMEREEFMNVGIVLFCKKQKYLQAIIAINHTRLGAFAPLLDRSEIELYLMAFKAISEGTKAGGPIALLDVPSRFRWLTATRSTVIQVSKTHVGMSSDLDNTLQKLFAELVEM